MNEFFEMSGYARFVWPSFALGIGIVILNLWLALRSLAIAHEEARRRMEMQS